MSERLKQYQEEMAELVAKRDAIAQQVEALKKEGAKTEMRMMRVEGAIEALSPPTEGQRG